MNHPPSQGPSGVPPVQSGASEQFGAARSGLGHAGKRINLVKLAESQRHLLWCILARIGVEVLPFLGRGTGGAVGIGSVWVYLAVSLAVLVVTIVFVVRMALAYGVHPVMGVLGGIVMVVPCAGLLILLLLNQRVTSTLQQAGVKVGLMGVGSAEMHKLRVGVCRGCGYDLRGLPSPTCPECGSVIQV